MAPPVPGKQHLEPSSLPTRSQLAQLAKAPALETPRGAPVNGLSVIELGSLGAFRGHLFQHLYS